MTVRVKNWELFQHYRDRKPPWIKLHRSLLDNMDFHMLSDDAGKCLPLIWLIASELDGDLPEAKTLSFRLRIPENTTQLILDELENKDFLCCAAMEQDATPKHSKWPSRYIPKAVRDAVTERDDGKCVWCGSAENVEFDHMIPISKGGESSQANIQLLCRSCNRRKRIKGPIEAERLATQLRSPEGESEGESEGDLPPSLRSGESVSLDSNTGDLFPSEAPTVSTKVGGIDKDNTKAPYTADFLDWYSDYPWKSGKAGAFREWKTAKRNKLLPALAEMRAKLVAQKASYAWTTDNGKYIPKPKKYIKDGHYDDEVVVEPDGWEDD